MKGWRAIRPPQGGNKAAGIGSSTIVDLCLLGKSEGAADGVVDFHIAVCDRDASMIFRSDEAQYPRHCYIFLVVEPRGDRNDDCLPASIEKPVAGNGERLGVDAIFLRPITSEKANNVEVVDHGELFQRVPFIAREEFTCKQFEYLVIPQGDTEHRLQSRTVRFADDCAVFPPVIE